MIRSGIIAKKVGMTSLFLDSGESCPVTLFSLEGCRVVRQLDGSIQVGSGIAKHPTKPLRGHFAKVGLEPAQILGEFRVDEDHRLPVGAAFRADYFSIGSYVDVAGITIGRGFAGCMKRHNFAGLRASHGVSVSHRSPGSTGNRKFPAKVFKGKKMAGHMGVQRVTLLNLKVVDLDVERGLLVVRGSVPGSEGSWVRIRDAIKKPLISADPHLGILLPEGVAS